MINMLNLKDRVRIKEESGKPPLGWQAKIGLLCTKLSIEWSMYQFLEMFSQ